LGQLHKQSSEFIYEFELYGAGRLVIFSLQLFRPSQTIDEDEIGLLGLE
jgi:hypothetical protein